VQVKSDDGKVMGTAYINPQALVCAALLSRKPNLKCGANFFKERLTTRTDSARKNSSILPYYRLFMAKAMVCPAW